MCNVSADELASRGATTIERIRHLGFDAIFICDPENGVFLGELIDRFGPDEVRGSFLCCCSDAVALAGPTATKLRASPTDLMRHCRGQPRSACVVLDWLSGDLKIAFRDGLIRLSSPLATLDWRLLLDCGVVLTEVKSFTFDLFNDIDSVGITANEQRTLGMPMIVL